MIFLNLLRGIVLMKKYTIRKIYFNFVLLDVGAKNLKSFFENYTIVKKTLGEILVESV